jgi:hypothetical protein
MSRELLAGVGRCKKRRKRVIGARRGGRSGSSRPASPRVEATFENEPRQKPVKYRFILPTKINDRTICQNITNFFARPV